VKPSDTLCRYETEENKIFIFPLCAFLIILDVFNDLIKNIKLYKEFPAQLETKDEYYSTNGLDEIIIDIYPEIKKGIKLNLICSKLYKFLFFLYSFFLFSNLELLF